MSREESYTMAELNKTNNIIIPVLRPRVTACDLQVMP